MTKIGRPTRLIAYDTELNIQHRQHGETPSVRIIRPRTIVYAAIIAAVSAIMIYTLVTREVAGINVIHDRNPMFVRLADGAIRNAFTIRILNKTVEQRTFRLSVSGITVSSLEIIGESSGAAGPHEIVVGPDQTREIRVLVTAYQALPPDASIPLLFTITDNRSGVRAAATDQFRGP